MFHRFSLSAMLCPLLLGFSYQLYAKNVILFIGDGMDEQQITAARNYLYGATGKTILDTLPVRSNVQVVTLSEAYPEEKIYVADSANSATSMATGTNTSIGRIATSAKADKDLQTILQIAQKAGLKTGLVTTSSITDATPASFIAHVSDRGCQSTQHMHQYDDHGSNVIDCTQDMKSNDGKGSIAEQLADSQVDLLMGGGKQYFEELNEIQDKTILVQAKQNGFEITETFQQSQSVAQGKKLLALYSKKHLPVLMQGTNGAIAQQPEFSVLNYFHRYLGSVELPEIMECESNPEFSKSNTPLLKDMTQLAIQRLQNDEGFFLMIESASIDKESHKRNPCGSIGEAKQLFDSVELALEFAEKTPETLVLVTADHAQAAQIVPNGSMYDAYGVPVASPGHIARIKTLEGGVLAINYVTNTFVSEEHTGASVPLFANQTFKNAQGGEMIKPFLNQSDIFSIVKEYLDL